MFKISLISGIYSIELRARVYVGKRRKVVVGKWQKKVPSFFATFWWVVIEKNHIDSNICRNGQPNQITILLGTNQPINILRSNYLLQRLGHWGLIPFPTLHPSSLYIYNKPTTTHSTRKWNHKNDEITRERKWHLPKRRWHPDHRMKNQSPKGNMWLAIPVAMLCMVVNRNERK